ncbi:MAG: hypothetical protein KC493_14555, partial [Bacteriovoracaceae bacterium]|nr:hypothetical protein [Bacteriovoracaceae bacterium]
FPFTLPFISKLPAGDKFTETDIPFFGPAIDTEINSKLIKRKLRKVFIYKTTMTVLFDQVNSYLPNRTKDGIILYLGATMNKALLFFAFSILFCSCIPKEHTKSEVTFFKTNQKDFNSYINQKIAPSSPNLSLDKSIINNDYPIEIALYNDKKWYYNLPNLGEGFGTWVYKDGLIKLFAERKLFDMHIEIKAIKKGAESVAIEFSDRFGPQFLKMDNTNF